MYKGWGIYHTHYYIMDDLFSVSLGRSDSVFLSNCVITASTKTFCPEVQGGNSCLSSMFSWRYVSSLQGFCGQFLRKMCLPTKVGHSLGNPQSILQRWQCPVTAFSFPPELLPVGCDGPSCPVSRGMCVTSDLSITMVEWQLGDSYVWSLLTPTGRIHCRWVWGWGGIEVLHGPSSSHSLFFSDSLLLASLRHTSTAQLPSWSVIHHSCTTSQPPSFPPRTHRRIFLSLLFTFLCSGQGWGCQSRPWWGCAEKQEAGPTLGSAHCLNRTKLLNIL